MHLFVIKGIVAKVTDGCWMEEMPRTRRGRSHVELQPAKLQGVSLCRNFGNPVLLGFCDSLIIPVGVIEPPTIGDQLYLQPRSLFPEGWQEDGGLNAPIL